MGDTEIIIEPGKQDIVFKRSFDAPRDVVFRGADGSRADCQLVGSAQVRDDRRPEGGRAPAAAGAISTAIAETGEEFGFHGVFHEVSPELVVKRHEFEGFPGVPALEWMTLEERDGQTYLTAVSLAPSVEARDMVVATGMEAGARETYDRLEEVVDGLLARA